MRAKHLKFRNHFSIAQKLFIYCSPVRRHIYALIPGKCSPQLMVSQCRMIGFGQEKRERLIKCLFNLIWGVSQTAVKAVRKFNGWTDLSLCHAGLTSVRTQ